MHETFKFPQCPICDAKTGLEVHARGGGGITACCRYCAALAYAVEGRKGRQEWPAGYGVNPAYAGPAEVVKALSTWVCDAAWTSAELCTPPAGCRVVIAQNDIRVCQRRGTNVVANSCIPCSFREYPDFWIARL